MRFRFRRLIPALLAGVSFLSAPSQASADPTVVELFTSQGCSSCPPADRYFGELARRRGVIALAFHVDYWNYIGWRDPFSDKAWSDRQKTYGDRLGRRYVYTPQIVVDGAAETVGSKRRAVEALIADAARRQKLPVALSHADPKMMRIDVAGRAGYDGEPATIWLVFFDRERVTAIEDGENRGLMLNNSNIVRAMIPVGTWQGEAVALKLALPALSAAGHDDCAVLIQAGGSGEILGAGRIALAAGAR